MKKQLLSTLLISFFALLQAQEVTDSVTMGHSYENDIYYNLADGSTTSVTATDWTVGFYNSMFSAAIMTNSGRGVSLYRVSDDITTFSNVLDTANMSSWTELHDDYTVWDNSSAFEDERLISQSNYGWGEYNTTSHLVEGSRVFVIETPASNFYKVMVVKKETGVFTYRYATLDNSMDTTFVINTPDYTNKNYVFLNMDNHTVLDLEPDNTAWDIVFKKYEILYNGVSYYPVTGVLSNVGVKIAKVQNIPVADAVYNETSLGIERNIIGSDWKSFNMNTFSYDIVDSLTYFIKKSNGDVYKLYFTAFEGSSTGKIVFNKELIVQDTIIDTTSIYSLTANFNSITAYPNPTRGQVELILDAKENQDLQFAIVDMSGKTILPQREINVVEGLNAFKVNLNNYPNGVYFIQLNNETNLVTRKIMLQK